MYDSVCKFLAESFATDLASWLLGEPIALTQLSPTELSLEPLRADTLILLQSESMVLHVEFQTRPDEWMPFRMLDYRVRVYRRFPDKAMRQVVIYLKPTRSPLVQQTSFEIAGTRHQFEVLRLWEQPVEKLLSTVGLLPFAVLGSTTSQERVLQAVAQRIEQIDNRQAQNNLAAATALLAGLVLEEKLIRTMLRQEMIQESVIYQEITAQAEARGRAEGEMVLIERQLRRRIGEVSPQLQAQIQQLSVAQLEELGEALLDFEQESDLVAWLAACEQV